jgi:hypothetical protein
MHQQGRERKAEIHQQIVREEKEMLKYVNIIREEKEEFKYHTR